MAAFRWVLLLIGVILLLGVFGYSRGWFASLRRSKPSVDARVEPVIDALEPNEEERAAHAHLPPLKADSKIVAVRIMPQEGQQFPAEQLVLALRSAGLRHGKFGIFHFHAVDDIDTIRFSVATLIEPGSFDLSKLKESTYRGVSIFTVLPAPEDGVALFDEMLEVARQIARNMDGRLTDERGSTFSLQRERYMREEVIEFLRHKSVAAEARQLTGD